MDLQNKCPDSTACRLQVQKYIQEKISTRPLGPTPASYINPIITDMDVFPYNRFYRGINDCTTPRVFDREAGHRKWQNQLYAGNCDPNKSSSIPQPYKGKCFQIPCSTILPCVPEFTYKKPQEDVCVYISP